MQIFFIFTLISAFGLVSAVPSATVKLDYATYTGAKTDSYIAFKGVRYAEAPTGDLRWKEPAFPPTGQLGNVDATSYRASCVQGGSTSVSSGTSEDCLFLNVFVSTRTSSKPLPVMIWIHGGGLQSGSGQTEPKYIMDSSKEPIIFVSINYRLAQFGFLNSPEIRDAGSLNAGLLDQRAAIKWVNKYISSFGGDAARVTIWGQSAGGGSIMFQLVGNDGNNENLFQGAIGDSPSLSYTPNFDNQHIKDIYSKFVANAGCGSASSIIQCLRAADTNTLAAAGPKTLAQYPANIFLFAPVVDEIFLHQAPTEALQAGKFPKIPMLFGSNTAEGARWSEDLHDPDANTSTPGANEDTVFNFLQGQYMNLDRPTFDEMAKHYPLSDHSNSVEKQGIQMYGEARYICTANIIVAQAHRQGLNAWHYRYDNGASAHGAELGAFFNKPSGEDNAEQRLFLHMRQYWTAFVTGGKPVADNGVNWTPVSDDVGNGRLVLHPGSAVIEQMPAQVDRCIAWHTTGLEMGI